MPRTKIDFDDLFLEDIEQYYTIANRYVRLKPEDIATASRLAFDWWQIADRWNDLTADAEKLSKLNGIKKSDLQGYCYGKYRQAHLAHEHCLSIYKAGEYAIRRAL